MSTFASLPDERKTAILAAIEAVMPDLVKARRHLHQTPELSEAEFATTDFIAKKLQELELTVVIPPERRGLICDILADGVSHKPAYIALRGDIDALPIQDEKLVDYRSRVPGVMHACGHDVHACVVLGVAMVLQRLKLQGLLPTAFAFRAIFQPAEEIATGARYMIHHHALRDVQSILTLHVDPVWPVGCIGLKAGALTASCDMFRLVFHGRGGHGARPHLAIDPIEAGARWIQSAYSRFSRVISAAETVVISVGKFNAGHSANVIPETAELEGTLRTLESGVRAQALELLEDINEAIKVETGCRVEMTLGMSAPTVNNDVHMTELLRLAGNEMLGQAAVRSIERPSMGSEDFSYYLEHCPGAMMRLGVAGDQIGQAPLHNPHFDIDERSIAIGIKVLTAAVLMYKATSQS